MLHGSIKGPCNGMRSSISASCTHLHHPFQPVYCGPTFETPGKVTPIRNVLQGGSPFPEATQKCTRNVVSQLGNLC